MNLVPSEKQWLWMMGWCRDRSIPPGDETNWGNARSEYVKKFVQIGQKTSGVFPSGELVHGFISKIEGEPTYMADDPMINMTWDDGNYTIALLSVYLADGVRIDQGVD